MKKKKYNLKPVILTLENNNFPHGFVLKRELTLRECKYILDKLLGINISLMKEDFADEPDDYKEWCKDLKRDVNTWLEGKTDDDYIMNEYASDCADEQMGLLNMIPIIAYLQRKGII